MRTREQHFSGVPRLLGLLLLGLAGPSVGQEAPPVPERLTQADIQSSVFQRKPEVVECVKSHRQVTPETHGKVVMRWTIQPDGKTADVSCVSGCELQFSACVGEKIKTWTFPTHKEQGAPVDYPFSI
jgi:hypothetical protein